MPSLRFRSKCSFSSLPVKQVCKAKEAKDAKEAKRGWHVQPSQLGFFGSRFGTVQLQQARLRPSPFGQQSPAKPDRVIACLLPIPGPKPIRKRESYRSNCNTAHSEYLHPLHQLHQTSHSSHYNSQEYAASE